MHQLASPGILPTSASCCQLWAARRELGLGASCRGIYILVLLVGGHSQAWDAWWGRCQSCGFRAGVALVLALGFDAQTAMSTPEAASLLRGLEALQSQTQPLMPKTHGWVLPTQTKCKSHTLQVTRRSGTVNCPETGWGS